MNLLKKYTIIIFLTWLSAVSGAYTPIDLTISESAVYPFRFDPGNTVSLNNHFIKEIARYNYLNLFRTRYSLDYELEVRIAETAIGIFEVECSLNRKLMDGDIFYEKFDLSQVLMPSEFAFDLHFDNGENAHIIQLSGLSTLSQNHTRFVNQPLRDGNKMEISVDNVVFNYAESDKKRFEEQIIVINEYLAFDKLLDFNLQKSLQIDPDNTKEIIPNFIKIYDLKRFYNLFKNHSPSMDIPDYYRFNRIDKEIRFESQLRRLSNILAQNIDSIAFLPDTDFAEGSATLLKIQHEYLHAMAGASHLLEPVYMQVLNFFETHQGWDDFKTAFKGLFAAKYRSSGVDHFAGQLNRKLYEDYVHNAESLMAKEAYIEAVIFLNSAKTLCNNLPEFDCELYTFHRLSRAKYGIYDSYLSVAESALKAGSTSLAYTYLTMARRFQQQNSNLIISSGMVDKALSRLAWQFVGEGNAFRQADSIAQSLECYVNAKDIYSLIGVEEHIEYIDRQIARVINGGTAGNN